MAGSDFGRWRSEFGYDVTAGVRALAPLEYHTHSSDSEFGSDCGGEMDDSEEWESVDTEPEVKRWDPALAVDEGMVYF